MLNRAINPVSLIESQAINNQAINGWDGQSIKSQAMSRVRQLIESQAINRVYEINLEANN